MTCERCGSDGAAGAEASACPHCDQDHAPQASSSAPEGPLEPRPREHQRLESALLAMILWHKTVVVLVVVLPFARMGLSKGFEVFSVLAPWLFFPNVFGAIALERLWVQAIDLLVVISVSLATFALVILLYPPISEALEPYADPSGHFLRNVILALYTVYHGWRAWALLRIRRVCLATEGRWRTIERPGFTQCCHVLFLGPALFVLLIFLLPWLAPASTVD